MCLLKILIKLLLISIVFGDCGFPAIPKNSKIDLVEFEYPEETKIEYYCELPELTLLNGKIRICKNGQWVGSIPLCAEEINGDTIERIEVSDRTRKVTNYTTLPTNNNGKALEVDFHKGECVGTKNRLPILFRVFLRRQYPHISYLEVVVHTEKAINGSAILLEAVLHPMRKCWVMDSEAVLNGPNLLRLKISCDFVTESDENVEYLYYKEDRTQNITFRFNSTQLSICELRIFYRKFHQPHQCGSPDNPIHSTMDFVQYGSRYGAVPYYHFTCDKNFDIVGNPDVRCGISNTWLDPFPSCVPKTTCPVPAFEWEDGLTTVERYVYNGLYNHNGTFVAITGSMILFSCNEQNTNKVMIGDSVRICTESGKWSGIQPFCIDLDELKLDKYAEVFDQALQKETNITMGAQEDNTDCGFPLMPMYAKPTPGLFMMEDMRTHYPNGTKLQFHCESAFHIMSSQLSSRTCDSGKWTGSSGSCAINYGGKVELTGVTVTEVRSRQQIMQWDRPQRNQTNRNKSKITYYYDDNAFGGYSHKECVSVNVTTRQKWQLLLNESVPISSFYIQLTPGGMFGGYMSYGVSKNLTSRAMLAKVGPTQCKISKLYDYKEYDTYLFFDCESARAVTDQIILTVDPKLFDKSFDPQNVSLCSLTIFRGPESCGTPDRPLNSVVRIDNQIAFYSCDDGYELIGPQSVMCLPNGQWAKESPVCKLKLGFCPPFPPSMGTLFSYEKTGKEGHIVLGTLVRAECSPFLTFKGRPLLVGSRYRVCQIDGQWSGTDPFCIDADKYQSLTSSSWGISTKSLSIILGVFVSAILVVLLTTLVVCCHLTQKCYQCFTGKLSKTESTPTENPKPARPESRVDISEINATIEQLANFRPKNIENAENTENNEITLVVPRKDHSDC